MNCSGQPALAKDCPRSSNAAAEWGTHCHEMSEEQLANFLAGKPMTFDHIQDHEKRDVVQGYCEFVINKVYANFIRGADKSEAFIEAQVVIVDGSVYGTADFVVLRDFKGVRDACVVDLKTGFNDVVVPQNKQFANYAVGVKKKFNVNGTIRAIGYLPRIREREVPYEQWVITPEELNKWEADINAKASSALAILQGNAEPVYNAGDHCRWCPAEGKCPARNALLQVDAGAELLSDLVTAETFVAQVPPPTALSIEQRARLYAVKDQIEAYLASVESLLIADAQAGAEVPGHKLVLSSTRRGWIKGSEETIAEELITRGVDDPWQKKIITIGEVERKLGKGKIDDLTEMSTPTVLLVKESDKRAAIAADSAINNLLTDIQIVVYSSEQRRGTCCSPELQ